MVCRYKVSCLALHGAVLCRGGRYPDATQTLTSIIQHDYDDGDGDNHGMKIALDVDGVLADVILSWLHHNNANESRPKITKSEITDWDFWRKHKIDRDDFYTELNNCWKDSWRCIPPTESDLSSSTKDLAGLGRLDIVTARASHTDPYVKEWLDYHDISYDNYISVAAGPMKADLDYDVFIDDSPHNAQAFLGSSKRVMLYSQPWNLHIDVNGGANTASAVADDITIPHPIAGSVPPPQRDGIYRITTLSEAIDIITACG